MSDTVTLLHGTYRPKKKIVYFYDGLLVATDGLLSIPLSKPHWIQRAWRIGYNLSPDGARLFSRIELRREVEKQTAESAKETNESTDSGRQPATEDRVRQS